MGSAFECDSNDTCFYFVFLCVWGAVHVICTLIFFFLPSVAAKDVDKDASFSVRYGFCPFFQQFFLCCLPAEFDHVSLYIL